MCTFRVHLETPPDTSGASGPVAVTSQKIMVNVSKTPFLIESDVDSAAVISDSMGGFAVAIHLTAHGAMILDAVTASNKGQRMAILTQSKRKGITKSRWIAAPVVRKHVSDGVLIFTPDMTQEDAEHFVNGLNNVARKQRRADAF